MEWIFLALLGDVGREWPRDICCDETVMAGEGFVGLQLLFYPLVGGKLVQTLRDLSAVFNCEEPQVAVPLAQPLEVCLHYFFRGGSEGGEGVGEAWAREFPDDAVEVAWAGSDGGHLGRKGIDLCIP